MKRADKEHLKRVLIGLLISSMLFGMLQVPQMPPVTVVARADDDIDLLNAGSGENIPIGDITEEDILQPETVVETPEEEVLQSETAVGTSEEDLLQPETAGGTDSTVSADSVMEVSYIDGNGVPNSTSAIALSGNETELTPGWYVVTETITYDHSVILNGAGEYHIILSDNETMNIGTYDEYVQDGVGLGYAYDNNSKSGINLTIYGQEGGSGTLEIYNGCGSSEGRPEDEKVGDGINVDKFTINGGKVVLEGGASRSYEINSRIITINDGTIVASGKLHAVNCTGSIIINGGELTSKAENNPDTYGINCTGNITINGGTVNADAKKENGHAINSTGNITINGGEVTATATGVDGHAINSTGDITINGGTVTANATMGGNALYCGGNITISGNVTADSTSGYAIYSNDGEITINGGIIDAHTSARNANAIVGKNDITINSGKVTAVTEGCDASGIKSENGNITINDGEVYAEALGAINPGDQNFGIFAHEKLIINGGKVAAKGSEAGIRSDLGGNGALSLSWKNLTDYVSTNSFMLKESSTVTIATGKAFIDNNEHFYIPANASAIKVLTDVKLSPTTDSFYTVSFDCGGYNPTDPSIQLPSMQLLKSGSRVTLPEHPAVGDKKGSLDFAGWYQDTGYQIKYNFTSEVTSDLYLHAKWATKSTNIDDAFVKMIYRYKNGSTIDPVVENNIGETLTKGTDYTITSIISEKTNSSVTEMTDPGFYKLTIKGTNKTPNYYSGTKNDVRVCVLTFGEYNPSAKVLNNNATLPDNTDAAVVTDSTVTMNSGWYVVTDKVKVNSRMVVKGDVHLVLCDGAELDAGGNGGTMGISVTEGNSLTIYSQAGNTGKLKASSNEVNWYAGIGGDAPNGNQFPYLGQNINAGNITIHGGEIITRGSYDSAAIGMARGGKGGKITIYGGRIKAMRYAGANGSGTDTGIGGEDADIHISWCRKDGQNADYILSDGYQGDVNFDKPFLIEGTSTIATPANIIQYPGKKILPTESAETRTVTFDSNGGTAVEPQTVAFGKTAVKPVTPIKQGYQFGGWYQNSSCTGNQYNFSTAVKDNLTLHAKWTQVSSISYKGANGTVNNFRNYSPMEADYTVLTEGNYYVNKNVSLLNRVKVSGNVSLILGDGKKLTAGKGISVVDEENTLNIFGQSGGTGVLSANAAKNNAAIGGDDVGDDNQSIVKTGNINIYGGIIRPQGGDSAASIGGGYRNRSYGRICIYGGTISGQNGPAMGGKHGSAIGGGYVAPLEGEYVTGTVEILGGKITVNGNSDGTGIGGGENSCGGEISILGGQVYVGEYLYDGIHYPGIGDGDDYTKAKKARITLGCREGQDDFIYSANYRGNVRVAPNHALKIKDTGTTIQGNISDPASEIAGKTLVFGHVHKFLYTVNESTGTVTATCENDGCDLPDGIASLTLSAPSVENLIYDGTEKPVTVTDEHSISGDEVVKYEKKTGDTWDNAAELTNPPKSAGTYRASITLADTGHGTATVSVEYTIQKREVTISGITANSKIYDGTTTASVNDTAKNLENTIDCDDVNIVPGNANFDSADAGENKTVTFTEYRLGGVDAGNYNLVSQPESMSANIAKRPVTIKANDQTVQFREAITEMAATYDQGTDQGLLVNRGHKLTALTLTPDPDPRSISETVENGTITAAGAVIKRGDTDVTQNYDISYVNGSLKIIMIRAKVTKPPKAKTDLKYLGRKWIFDNKEREYIEGGQPLVYPGEAETKMEYKVEWISRGDGSLLKNADGTNVCDNPAPTEGYSDNYNAWMAGSYHVWYRAASDNSHAPGKPLCVSVNMARAPLNVKIIDETIPYGERFLSMNYAVEGLMDSEDSGRIGSGEYSYLIDGVWKKASDFKLPITQTYPVPGIFSAKIEYDGYKYPEACPVYFNYDYTYVPGFLTVKPRTVSLNWGGRSFTYDGKAHVPTVTLSNLSENEVHGAVGVTVSGAKVNAGNYTATAVALSGAKADRYALPSENTIDFSIAKVDYPWNIPNVEVSVPVSADSFTASVAGRLDRTAGELTYGKIRTISTNGFIHKDDGIKAKIDQNGLVTVSINRNIQNNIVSGNKLFICPDVDSTNYNTKSITVEATFVDKTDAGVRITEGDSVSVNFVEAGGNLTLAATVDCSGTGGTWTWESSNSEVAEIVNGGQSSNCNLRTKGVGTAAITAKYDSDTATGYATTIITVNPIFVSIPMAVTGLIYDGAQKTGVAADNTHYTLTGEKGTLPGDYVAAATLTDTEHCRWSDGTEDPKFIPWSIEKQPGPFAPTGLTGISPTTLKNLDGKITGVDTNMEYSKDAAFGEAFPCTGTEIIGLTPGTYYVRIKEKETVKAGDAVAVVIEPAPVPIVRAIEGLTYKGTPQTLVEADTVSEGRIYYAVTKIGEPEPSKDRYTTTIPKKTDAGQYEVWYEIRGAGETDADVCYVVIAKKNIDNDAYYTGLYYHPHALFGASGMIDISDRFPEGEIITEKNLFFTYVDGYDILERNHLISDGGNHINGIWDDDLRLHYSAKNEEEAYPSVDGKPRYVDFIVSVCNLKNYQDYRMDIVPYFYNECSTNHADTEPVGNSRVPNCTEKGYTGDNWCHDCHAILKGEDIPIDPDVHDFDYSEGEMTTPPTPLTWGWHTYHCIHDHAHTITKQDVPPLPSDDGVDYSDFVKDTRFLSGNAAVSQNERVDAATGEVIKTVAVGGDEVSKITTDPKSGKETVESKIWVAGLQSSYTYTGSAIKPSFHVYDGTRELTEKKDYLFTYKDNKETGTANIRLKFKGNYKGKGEQTVSFAIVPAVLGKDILAYDIGVPVKNNAQKPLPALIWASTGKAVNSKFFTVTYDGAESVKEEKTYTATIISKNKNYEGRTTAKVRVIGKKGALMSKASVKFAPTSYVYTGSEIIPAKGSYTLKIGRRELVEGTDYRLVKVINNTDPGTATVVFEGLGTSESSPAGTKTATFKITGNRKLQEAGSGSDFTYSFLESVPYAKGGAKPAIVVKDKGVTLKEGKDYTLSYTKNRAVTSKDKKAEIKVKGKGNYKGSVILNFEITKQSLKAKGITIEAADQFTALKKLKKPSVTVIDVDGKKLKAKTDYEVGEADTSVPGNTDESGEVFVTVTGKGNYSDADSVKISFRYMSVSSNLSKTRTMKSVSSQTYTGSYVLLGNADLKGILYTGSKNDPKYLTPGKDFVVSGYKNNIKKGTAKVTLKGIGAFGGTKTLNFKIIEKQGDYKGALIGDKWQ